MARTDVGTNNINFLEPTRGIFGTRNSRGASAVASDPEYLYTQVNKVTRMICLEKDQHLLSYGSAGRLVEPTCFFPIVPTILINGASSVGVGFKTYVHPHHVGDIISNLVRLIDKKLTVPMLPFYRGFSGFVEEEEGGGFITGDVWAALDNDTVQITELPVKTSTRKYRQFLCRLCRTGIVKGMKKKYFPLVFVLIFGTLTTYLP
jgi:DNA topoisomerase-2